MSQKLTPMLQQYLAIKAEHEDAILFYRMGDFYEMFFDDAVTASQILGITLTSRNSKADKDKIPLCGVPYHAAAGYLNKLIRAGLKVAICEQVENPKEAKGVVKREVIRVITPGLATNEQLLDDKSNLYIAAVSPPTRKTGPWGLSIIDLSTGEFMAGEFQEQRTIGDEIIRRQPQEILYPDFPETDENFNKLLQFVRQVLPDIFLSPRPKTDFASDSAHEILTEHFKTANLAGFGCENFSTGLTAAGALFTYVSETQKTGLSHIAKITAMELDNLLIIDESSRRNLEITQSIADGRRQGSLLEVLDFTRTPMGARLLKKNILEPRREPAAINERLDTVSYLYKNAALREDLREGLTKIHDLERLNSRMVLGQGNARDLTALKCSLQELPELRAKLRDADDRRLGEIHQELDTLDDLAALLERAIREEAPIILRDGKLIKPGFNAELDELMEISTSGKRLILELENREKEHSGINNLKIGFNKVFGYYLEVSKAQSTRVPDYFIRKQTLVNAERFITPELKEFENKVLGAEEKRVELEYRLFTEVRAEAAAQSPRILAAARRLAWLDFFTSLAEAARRYKYIRPEVNDKGEIIISEGRHPVIEQALPAGRFVPNDLHLDQRENEVLIITGPNMAGKSTVLRQAALIVLMAQMGSFVPAHKAVIGAVDRIFTRVGAMDNLRQGQSTFMVEMNETANILNNVTDKSLVILDEIGRGTSTFDGLAIAWAVTEDLINKNGCGVKTIFATHYHELIELAGTSKRVKNFNIAVREWNERIIFLHKLLAGGTNKSYGIQVAALAGVPDPVIKRAKELLKNIEQGEFNQYGKPCITGGDTARTRPGAPAQLELFAPAADPLHIKLAGVDPNLLSPMEALTMLYELKGLAQTTENN
ncbi:DNA mismatch repair protein MutS [hydrothermal vent metagenome]|uniref:DNA mismatch repair protein MutS n=1 Tax=hydrothermal vent metagenome TaxID=652676 RepID=A0A3B0VUF2_9ZZZZ